MQNKTNEELLTILSEVCAELQQRAVGLADIGGNIEPIIEKSGNAFMCVNISSTFNVGVMRGSVDHYRVVMFENGRKLSDQMSGKSGWVNKIKAFLDGEEKIEQESVQSHSEQTTNAGN